MQILVAGGSGFIGRGLIEKLTKGGHQVRVADRQPPAFLKEKIRYFPWEAISQEPPTEAIKGTEAIINLVGENIFAYWTKDKKERIFNSRVLGTRNLVSAIKKSVPRPKVFISASAVGYYGDKGDKEISENSLPGSDFLAALCQKWEEEARIAETLGLRTAQVRTALVLGRGGFLTKILPLFKMGLGGVWGSGKQWFPWIHFQDIVRVYIFLLETEKVSGAVNAASPDLITNKIFVKTLSGIMRKPSFLRLPRAILKTALGEQSAALLASQKVVPQKLLSANFRFLFPNLKQALEDVFEKKEPQLTKNY